MNIRLSIKASLVAGLLILSQPALSSDLERRQSELKSIQAQINKQQSALQDTGKQREKLVSLLKSDEKAIAEAAKRVNATKSELAALDAKLVELNRRQQQLDTLRLSQQQTLSKQLSSAYLAGNHDYSKMLLNQQDPASIERLLAYYQYLNKARTQAIDQLKQTLSALNEIRSSQKDKQQQLNALVITQQEQAKRLSQEQSQRKSTLTELQRTLSSKAEELEQLQIEEASLKRIVEQALLAMKDTPAMDGLDALKGKLGWPTKGRVSASFGSSRSGRLNWKGIMLAAPEGQNVNAVAAGQVIYADWLRGFGMVLVIDHGKGYMSLYGHAQALLKAPGDLVKTGEAIALVGRSGGQTEPGLYFEVRHKGQAVDPARYCH
ncbi:peptidoglycan DD-metalloendopeptidase family protein [Shewanella sp. AS16]|uniref:murein hydrolase activator EnvC family protein n=1 Tax=Shewanella sp. AS16 TaxID=2907625 RepID=UPI001F1AAAAD|nr:peptidoglycan DD-metalloendopeptidase family protein [Shewanella sp. AS16]MCE9688157.1 peptidoglycan DD-metalloendopeptidase family protein [Shewanella sp. AS16]